jgi:NSS family neurotransmitter:Na+ symporter
LQADYREILSRRVLSQAAGQAFFSLSLGMGAMLTYASYLSKDQHLPNESLVIAAADFAVAFIAGLVVFPLLFALGLSSQVGESTVGALFITLPGAFGRMGTAGQLVGVLFFTALIVGALTSAISLLEVVVASAMDGLQWSRHRSAIVLGGVIALCGLPAAVDIDVLGAMDEVANNIFLLGGGLALAVFVGWVMPDPIGEVQTGAPGVRWFFLWRTLLRFVVPAVLLYILVDAIPRTLATVRGLVG